MNQGISNKSGGSGTNPKIQSFLEALRSSQGKVDRPTEANSNPFSEFQNRKEIEKKRIESFYQARTQEWNRIFSAKEKQTEQRIEQVRVELKKELERLSKQTKALDANITQAIINPVVNPGIADLTYFDHIKQVFRDFALQVSQANSWLEMYNRRSKKKSYFWGMAGKKGTSFTLNNERTAATSVG